jgi:hypothetical protein
MAMTPHRIKEGKLVHIADQVARHRLEEADGAAGALDHANPATRLPGVRPFQKASNSVK